MTVKKSTFSEKIRKYKFPLLVIGIVILTVCLILGYVTISMAETVDSTMDRARDRVSVYIPEGYPDDYFHNLGFQDPVSICTYKLNKKEDQKILSEISFESSNWHQFTKSEASKLYDMLGFLDKKDRKMVNFDTESYYCCYSRDGRHPNLWLELKEVKYYSFSYYIFIYNPNERLYNLIVI